jgi:hypothetical protein
MFGAVSAGAQHKLTFQLLFYPRFHQGKTKRLLAIYLENDVAIVGPVPHVSPTLAYMGVAKDH